MSKKQLPKEKTTLPIVEIDLKQIVEHGESPTAIILSIAILLWFLLTGITELVSVISVR